MKYSLIIFDLDGTLLNTLADLAGSLSFALERLDLPKRSIDEVRRFVGNGIPKLIERAVPAGTSAQTTQEVLSAFTEHYRVHCADSTVPYDGIYDMLAALRSSGRKAAVVSNKSDYAVQALCEKYFGDTFSAVAGARPGIMKKPAPDAVNAVLSQLGIDRQDAVYIGDSEVDIETAANARMDCISVDWGFRSREQLLLSGAARIISRPVDILSEI